MDEPGAHAGAVVPRGLVRSWRGARALLEGGSCALGGGLAVSAQQFQVFAIPTAGNTTALLYFGERWGSAPTGLKADDFQVRLVSHISG